MTINVSVQYNRGLLPDSILLTLCDYIIGEPFRYHKEFLSLQPVFPLNYFDIFSPEGGCSEGLDAFRSVLNNFIRAIIFRADELFADRTRASSAIFR